MMRSFTLLVLVSMPALTMATSSVLIENFNNPIFQWSEMNDPLMGGLSTGTLTYHDNVARLIGNVVDVPKLQMPGFIMIQTSGNNNFPDISHCQAIKLVVRSENSYSGFRVAFGTKSPPNAKGGIHGFKANLKTSHIPLGTYETITIPFTKFSNNWNPYTGDQEVTCPQEEQYCPDTQTLQNIKELSIWAEGVEGKVDLRISQISAVECQDADNEEEDKANEVKKKQYYNHDNKKQTNGTSWLQQPVVILSLSLLTMAALALVVKKIKSHRRRRGRFDIDKDTDDIEVEVMMA